MTNETKTSSPKPSSEQQKSSSSELTGTSIRDSTASQESPLAQSDLPTLPVGDANIKENLQEAEDLSDGSSSNTTIPASTNPQKRTEQLSEMSTEEHQSINTEDAPQEATSTQDPSSGIQDPGLESAEEDVSRSPSRGQPRLAVPAHCLEALEAFLKHNLKAPRRSIGSPKLAIGEFSQEDFKSSAPSLRQNTERTGHWVADPPSRSLCIIEVLLKKSIAPEFHPRRRRHIIHNRGESIEGSLPDVPDQIRIRSTFLLDLLHRITDSRLDHGGANSTVNKRDSLVFLHPFKFLLTYAKKIEEEVVRLQSKLGSCGQSEESHMSNAVHDGTTAESTAQIPEDADRNPAAIVEDDYQSEKALKQLELLTELFKTHLKPLLDLKESYRLATHDTVLFEDLWLLFEVGGLAFEREPQQDHPPRIVRVLQFDGGRQLLNNSEWKTIEPRRFVPEPNSKGVENRFNLRYYSLDYDGDHYGPVEDRLSIPPWEGPRSIYDLKVFPLNFCRNGKDHKFESLDDFRNHVVRRGKEFVKLDTIDHRHYNGQVIGTHREFYNSQVVIDFKLQGRDTKAQPGFLGLMESVLRSEDRLVNGLSIYPGDPREVREGTARTNNPAECTLPGCDGNDFIHDDMLLGETIAHREIGEYGITSAKFSRSDLNDLKDEDYALFPTFVEGYVLNSRVWAKLNLDLVTSIRETGDKFDTLQIPEEYKTSLKALVNDHSSIRDGLDIVPGKGRGTIILLHGRPGVGKTATAEAMAADMGRPLYPITYADLGDKPSNIETNLKRIFRYGQRWNCVLLLDEADVFLMSRDKEDTTRNSIVSIFLRNFEWYPGIIFMTTNRVDYFDEGVLDRVHLKLRYPKLDEEFTKNIFNGHFKKIKQLNERSALENPFFVTDEHIDQIHAWRKDRMSEASDGWWNGRQIRIAFHLAKAFAKHDMLDKKKATARIKLRHFQKVLKLHDNFKGDLANAKDNIHDAAD